MKAIELALIVNDEKLEGRITSLEIRCEKLNIPLSNILQVASPKFPTLHMLTFFYLLLI